MPAPRCRRRRRKNCGGSRSSRHDFPQKKNPQKIALTDFTKTLKNTSERKPKKTMSDKPPGSEKKVVAGILAILLGGLAIHKFYLGYTKEGIIQIVITVCTCGIGGLIGLIEGIIYLTKSDEDFVATYVTGRKGWF
jgi:TM2 domain-containing membrane protein YozV